MTDQLAQEMTHSMDLIGQITQLAELTLSGPVNDEQIRNLSSLINLEFLNLSEAGRYTHAYFSVRVATSHRAHWPRDAFELGHWTRPR